VGYRHTERGNIGSIAPANDQIIKLVRLDLEKSSPKLVEARPSIVRKAEEKGEDFMRLMRFDLPV
jgi:hypothetical protein